MPTATYLDALWLVVSEHPDDADAKRRLANALYADQCFVELGTLHSDATPEQRGELMREFESLITGLRWAASRGKHPRRLDGIYRWYEAKPSSEGDTDSIHQFLWDCMSRMNWNCRPDYPEMLDAFSSLGKAIRELREIVREEPTT